MTTKESQADKIPLSDISNSGKERPWKKNKEANTYLSFAYDEINENKAARLRECGSFLTFRVMRDGKMKLHDMNSCHVRLCPMCAWRRSLKIAANVNKIMQAMKAEKQYAFIFVTLTMRNCEAGDLDSTLDDMMKGWDRLSKVKAFKTAIKGWYRGLEVTHDIESKITPRMYNSVKRQAYYRSKGLKIGDDNPSYNTYHPHFHCIFAVNTSYFAGKEYIKQNEWSDLWKNALRLDYTPQVDARRIKGDTSKAVAEAAKYSVKDKEYIIRNDWDLTIETVVTLDSALDHRRLVAFGGKLREWHKKLKLDDEMSGDLINIDDVEDENWDGTLTSYSWNTGYNQYFRV